VADAAGTTAGSPGTSKGLVLVVEDEAHISDLLRLYLKREGFGVHVESDGRAGLAAARSLRPVAIVLDVGLPTLDGTEVCRALRAEGNWVPILFVTARDDEVDRIVGLELGADDYVTKPFSPKELLARVRRAMRRAETTASESAPEAAPRERLTFDDVRIDFTSMEVVRAGKPLAMTAQEFKLLKFFANSPDRVISREELLNEVWGYENYPTTRTVDNHVLRLRRKLEEDPANPRHFLTMHGAGYRFTLGTSSSARSE
jgi:two-component system, OmpR family, response regulator